MKKVTKDHNEQSFCYRILPKKTPRQSVACSRLSAERSGQWFLMQMRTDSWQRPLHCHSHCGVKTERRGLRRRYHLPDTVGRRKKLSAKNGLHDEQQNKLGFKKQTFFAGEGVGIELESRQFWMSNSSFKTRRSHSETRSLRVERLGIKE